MPMSSYIAEIRAKIGHMLLMSPGVAAIIFNDQHELLLQHRSDNGLWGLPGGAIDPGEEPAEAVVREVYEETGLRVLPERVVGVFGGPDLRFSYPNGDEIMVISIVFECRIIGGELGVNDDESLELRYFDPNNLPSPFTEHHRVRIEQALRNPSKTVFYFQGEYKS